MQSDDTKNYKVIKIYNPNEFPFGPLSNNSIHEMLIDGKRYSTVTNYILSNILITPMYKIILQNAPVKGNTKLANIEDKVRQIVSNAETRKGKLTPEEIKRIRQNVIRDVTFGKMNIQELFNFSLQQENFDLTRTCLEKAYNAKILDSKELQDTLLSTGNRPILYISNNSMLGTGTDGKGQNLIGKILSQIRHNLRLSITDQSGMKKEKQEVKDILQIYRAMAILRKELSNDNTLEEYLGMDAENIIDHFLNKNPEENFESLNLGENIQESVLELYKRGNLKIIDKEIQAPGYLVLAARRDNLKELQKRFENRKAELILNKFNEYIIRQNYPRMPQEDVEKAAKQFFQTAPSLAEYLELRSLIQQKYLQGKLNDELNQEIEIAISTIPKISDKTIKKSQIMIEEKEEIDEEKADSSSSSSISDDPIKLILTSKDDKAHKYSLIQQLQKFTGKSSDKYKKWSLEKIQSELEKYTGSEATKQPKVENGRWIIELRTGAYKKITLDTIEGGIKPSEKHVLKLFEKYNKKNNTDFSRNRVSVSWISDLEVELKEEQVEKSYVKEFGIPVEIKPLVEENKEELKEFSPLFQKSFVVDSYTFNSVSIYITAMLITQTGITRDISNKNIYKRGTSLEDARKLLLKEDGNFVTPDQANLIYTRRKIESFRELTETFARIAIKKKFEDINLGQLLASTGDAELVYNDPYDTLLGTGTKEYPGQNIGGVILMQTRTDIFTKKKEYGLEEPFVSSDIALSIFKDQFLLSWLKMRLLDMCNTVHKFQTYLLVTGKQEEEIDDKFITIVLDLVFPHCNLDFETENITMPEYFVNMVSDCAGLSYKLSRDYDKEIKQVRDELIAYDDKFYGRKSFVPAEIKKPMSPEKFAKTLEAFKNMSPAPSRKQLKEFEKALTDEFEGRTQIKEMSFDVKQRKDWEDFLNEIYKPEKSFEYINKKMEKLRKTQKDQLKSSKNKSKLRLTHKTEQQKLWDSLTKPKLSTDEIDTEIKNFIEKQQKERREYSGIKISPKTSDEILKRKQDRKVIKEKISRLNQQRKDELNHFSLITNKIANVYWHKISALLYVVSKNLSTQEREQTVISSMDPDVLLRVGPSPTTQKIKELIINAELLNSNPELKCENILQDLENNEDNCISSAICNILVAIQGFKYQYGEDIPFGKDDIDLAVNIILGNKQEIVSKPVIQEVEEGEQVEYMEEDFEGDMEVEADIEDGEVDYGENLHDDEEGFDEGFEFGFSRFAIKKPSDKKETVRNILSDIAKKSVKDNMVDHFIKSLSVIKYSKLPDRIKINRINFFATLT